MIGKASAKSKATNWWTPDDLYAKICRKTGIYPQLDVAADKRSRKCKYYFSKKQNALKTSWMLCDISNNSTKKWVHYRRVPVWCNPPGDQVQRFVNRALDQWMKYDIDIVMLIPVNTITNKKFEDIWHMVMMTKQIAIYPLFGKRPNFLLNGKKNTKYASRNGYIVLVFKKR